MKRFLGLFAAGMMTATMLPQPVLAEKEEDGIKRGWVVVCYYGALSQDRRRVGKLKESGEDFLLNGTTETMPVQKIPIFYVDESAEREDVMSACINARDQEPFDKAYKVRAAYAAKSKSSFTYYLLMFGENGPDDLYLSGLERGYW